MEFDLDLDAHIERPAAHERNEDDVYELSSDDLAQGFGNFAPVEDPEPISLLQPDTFSEPDLDAAGEDIDPLSTELSTQESLLFAEIEAQPESAATDDVGAFAELAVDAPPDVSSIETSNIEPEPADVHTATVFQESEPPVLPQPIEPAESVEESPAPIPLIATDATDATADEPLPALESSESPAADSSPVAEEVAAPIEEPAPEAPPVELLASEPVVVDAPDLSITDGSAPSADPPSKGGNHRRKRHQQKSARARKDKLRSTTKPESIAGQTVVAAPAAAAAPRPRHPSPAG